MVRLGACLVKVVVWLVWLTLGELDDGKEGEERNWCVECVDGEELTLWL